MNNQTTNNQETLNSFFQIAEIEIVYKSKVRPSQRPKITDSKTCYEILKQYWNANTVELREEFHIILLNRAHRVLGISCISQGGISGTVADPKLIWGIALKAGAVSAICAHNHPSGNNKPSQADIDLTKKLKEGGRILDIVLLDHIIYCTDSYFSFADEGML